IEKARPIPQVLGQGEDGVDLPAGSGSTKSQEHREEEAPLPILGAVWNATVWVARIGASMHPAALRVWHRVAPWSPSRHPSSSRCSPCSPSNGFSARV